MSQPSKTSAGTVRSNAEVKTPNMEKDKLPALTTALKTTQAASRWTLNSKARRHDLLQSLSQKVISPGTAGPSLSTSASAGALAKEESEREKRAAKEVAKAEANRLRKATMLNEENVHAVARRCEILKNRNYKAKVARGEVGISLVKDPPPTPCRRLTLAFFTTARSWKKPREKT